MQELDDYSRHCLREVVIELLAENCALSASSIPPYYLLDKCSYNKIIFKCQHLRLLAELEPHYSEQNQFYICREITFSSFVCIMRHICKALDWEIAEYSNNTRRGKTYHVFFVDVVPENPA